MTFDKNEKRAYREAMNQRIQNEGSTLINRFFRLDSSAYEVGALSAKNKELMGLVASTVLRCDDCIFYHLDRSIAEGATREELTETLNIALIVGGSIVIPHLRRAFEAIDALFEEN